MKTPGQTVGPKDELAEGRRERRKDGQTLFHRVLPDTKGDPLLYTGRFTKEVMNLILS